MGFTNRCFVRTVDKSLIRRLKSIGRYFNNHMDDNYNLDRCEERYMNTYPIFSCMIIYDNMLGSIIYCNDGRIKDINIDLEKAINCGTNEELFLAIAALRDDSDKNQYFWYKDELFKCIGGGSTVLMSGDYSIKLGSKLGYFDVMKSKLRKATVKELINHFA